MKELNLTITQEDIDSGVQCKVTQCAIARAFARLFDGIKVWACSTELCIIAENYEIIEIPHTPAIKGLIQTFDVCRSAISPQTLVFEIPDDIYEKYFNVVINKSSNQEAPKGVSESLQSHQGANQL